MEFIKKHGVLLGFLGAAVVLSIIFIITIFNASTGVTLGQYMGLEVEVKEVVVTDQDVENEIIDDVTRSQEDVDISNRPVRNGDTVIIDYAGRVDGVEFEGGTDTDSELQIGSGDFIDGFEEQIIGMNKGQTADITVTFPNQYSSNSDLAGKEAVFTVTVKSISGKVIPAKITDAMIRNISDEYTTVADYRVYIRGLLEEDAKEQNEALRKDAVWEAVFANTTVRSPSSAKMSFYSGLYEGNYTEYAEYYEVDLTTLVEEYAGITMAEFREEVKLYGTESATRCAIVEAIAAEQGISISDEDYAAYLEEEGYDEEDDAKYGEAIRDDILFQKVLDFIVGQTTFIVV